jgi:CHAT domain-containing protein/tetratricopeptide (TPR) repeat protein
MLSDRFRSFLALVLLASPIPALEAAPGALPIGTKNCQARFTAAPDAEESAECFYRAGRDAGNGGLSGAAGAVERLLARNPDHPWLLFYLGHLRWEDPASAEEPYRRAAQAFIIRRDATGEVRARAALHSVLVKLGRVDEAAAEMERAVALGERTGDPLIKARGWLLQAQQIRWSGEDLQTARRFLHAARSAAIPDGPYPLQRDCLEELANVSYSLGRLAEARAVYGEYAELAAAHGDRRSAANARYGALRILVEDHIELPRPETRGQVAAQARELLAAAPENHRELAGRVHLLLGRLSSGAEARQHFALCLSNLANPADRVLCLTGLSQLQRLEGAPDQAERTVREALALAHTAQTPWARAHAWRERMRVSWSAVAVDQEQGREQALADSESALNAIESIRGQQSGESGRAGLLAIWAEDYYWLAGRLLAADDVDAAFGVMERLRARTLLEALGRAQAAPSTTESSGFARLAEVRRALQPDEALLSFQIGADEGPWGDTGGGSWLLVTTREETRVHRLRRDRVALRPAVRLFTGLFERRDGSEERPAAGLHADLLAEALGEIPRGIRRLVIVPDDALHRLPFAALRAAQGELPLTYRYEITVVPSATLWLRWRAHRPSTAAEPLLALADPTPLGGASGPAPVRAATRDLTELGPLPHARREGRAAIRHLDGGSLLRLGDDASEGFFKNAALRRFAILHFATHAVVDDQVPERSGVLLTPAPGSEDGLLQIREIVPLALDGRIVVLSSCRSASGTVLRGEGVVGLARAFFQAGAHTVVASLWPLRDDDGAALFDRFYRHLGQGMSVAAALRAAQRDRADDGAPAYAWAGLVVLGDGDLVPLPGGRRTQTVPLWISLASAAALLSVGALAWRRRAVAAS